MAHTLAIAPNLNEATSFVLCGRFNEDLVKVVPALIAQRKS